MKIEVKNNSGRGNIKQCEYPLDWKYFGNDENEEQLKIFIEQETLSNIDEYLSSDLNNELGGVLIGDVCISNDGKLFIQIANLIIAKHTNSSLSRLTFTHETWNYINLILERDFSGKKILGWFHSHPGHTVFLSSFDVFIQENFFDMPYMVAYVFDPTIRERGFFFWNEKKIVKASGFYVYKISKKDAYSNFMDTDNELAPNDTNIPASGKNQGKQTIKPDSKNIIILSLMLLILLLIILMIYNLYDLKQKVLLKEEYRRDLSELKDDTRKLNERFDEFIEDDEQKNKNYNSNSSIDSNKAFIKYTVKSGDTVDKIADEFYKNKEAVQVIIQKNNLKNKWDIKIGQVLDLPVLN